MINGSLEIVGARPALRFERLFPRRRTVDLVRAGHYLQDDAPDDVVAAITSWWDEVEPAR